jgi:hypothetical protein
MKRAQSKLQVYEILNVDGILSQLERQDSDSHPEGSGRVS